MVRTHIRKNFKNPKIFGGISGDLEWGGIHKG
jgi:hypothetical protein